MKAVAYVTVDVFTTTRFGGNPLAVVPDARDLSDEAMQSIASEFCYSETTFVLPPRDPANTARVRIFTRTAEIPFAGHPNVGTAFVLGRQDDVFRRRPGDAMRFEEKAGLVEVNLVRDGGAVAGARIRAPRALEIGHGIDPDVIAACASLPAEAVVTLRHAPVMASVGLPFALAELANLDALARARPNAAAFAEADARYRHDDDRFSLFLYVRQADEPAWLRARMFAPLSNTLEDPATGSASAALGAYLVSLRPEPAVDVELTVEQGVEMGRRSVIELDVRKTHGAVRDVHVTGRCVPVMRGTIEV